MVNVGRYKLNQNKIEKQINLNFSKNLNFQAFEPEIYQKWLLSKAFDPDQNLNNIDKNSNQPNKFYLPMPPPNITGELHLGHAYFCTLQDILIRFNRMQGKDTLWLPGTDHAGLATQKKLDQHMKAKGLNPHGDEFYSFAENYKQNLQNTISKQIQCMGSSCDWTRERFTLDNNYTNAITKALEICYLKNMLNYKDDQWWLDMSEPAKQLLDHLDNKNINIIPAFEEKNLREFLNNIEPWCISRQIRWGHQLPIWKNTSGQIKISQNSPGSEYKREKDTLDTWFSSSLWPFASLGWPNQTQDLEKYYPADLIETGADILFFWCTRMLMMGIILTDQLPFKTIYLHGMILDSKGKKMSKSDGNGIDPLKIIERWGTDSLRIYLCSNTTPSQAIKFDENDMKSSRSLGTKLWNASKFCLTNWERMEKHTIMNPLILKDNNLLQEDLIFLKDLTQLTQTITENLTNYEFKKYAENIRWFIWERFCSQYLETSKTRLKENDFYASNTLMYGLDQILKLLHPLAPYLTEYIFEFYSKELLIKTNWPEM